MRKPQGVPRTVERLALAKCLRDAGAGEGVLEVREPRFWELRPGALVGTLTVRVGREADEQRALRHVHSVFYNNLGPLNLTVQVRGVRAGPGQVLCSVSAGSSNLPSDAG